MSLLLRRMLPCAALVAACAAVPAAALGADDEIESDEQAVTGEVDVVSQYVWRTLTLSEGMVVQPSITFGRGPVELNLWANVDPAFTGWERLNELDYSLAVYFGRGPIEATTSFLLYTYPQLGAANTGELQIEARGNLPRGFGAFVRHARDVLDYRGAAFTTFGVDREWALGNGSLTVSSQVGRGSQRFSDAYFSGLPALTVAGLTASWSIPMGRGLTARPHVDWLEVVDRDSRALLPDRTPLTFGVAFGRL